MFRVMVSRWFQDSGKVAGFRGDVPRGFFFAPAAPFAVIPLAGVVQSRPFNRTGSSLISIGARGSSMASRLDRVAHNTRIGSALAFFFCFFFGLLFFLFFGGGGFSGATRSAQRWRPGGTSSNMIERSKHGDDTTTTATTTTTTAAAASRRRLTRFDDSLPGRGGVAANKRHRKDKATVCVCVCVCVCVWMIMFYDLNHGLDFG